MQYHFFFRTCQKLVFLKGIQELVFQERLLVAKTVVQNEKYLETGKPKRSLIVDIVKEISKKNMLLLFEKANSILLKKVSNFFLNKPTIMHSYTLDIHDVKTGVKLFYILRS